MAYSTNTSQALEPLFLLIRLCLAQLTDFVQIGVDKGKHTGIFLIDLLKTLDILDHIFLLDKMICFCFKRSVVIWLKNRKFLVSLYNVSKKVGILICNVPQWSILRPLGFLIYVNDLPQSLSESGSYRYTDDTYSLARQRSSQN